MGQRHRDFIDFKVLFRIRNVKDFYKDLLMGKPCKEMSHMLRHKMRNKMASLKEIQSLHWILTSKGRIEMLRRFKLKVRIRQFYLKNKGVTLPMEVLAEHEAEKQVNEFMGKYSHLFDSDPKRDERYEQRLAQFNEATREIK